MAGEYILWFRYAPGEGWHPEYFDTAEEMTTRILEGPYGEAIPTHKMVLIARPAPPKPLGPYIPEYE